MTDFEKLKEKLNKVKNITSKEQLTVGETTTNTTIHEDK